MGAGLYETHFTLTLALGALLAVLGAFGFLDGLILTSLQSLRAEIGAAPMDLTRARARLERLWRTVLLGGAAFGTAGLLVVVLLAIG